MRPQTDASYASGARSIWIEASVTWLTCPVDGELGATLPTARGTEKRTNLRRRYHPLSGHQKRVLGDNVFYGVLTVGAAWPDRRTDTKKPFRREPPQSPWRR